MDATKKDVKETIESSMSEEDLLNNIDTLNHPLAEEEMSNVAGGLKSCTDDPCQTGWRYY